MKMSNQNVNADSSRNQGQQRPSVPELKKKVSKYVLHADTSNYDFAARRLTPKPTNVFESIIHIVKAALGGGIMGIHEAFMKVGLWTAFFICLLGGAYITYCLYIIVSSAQILYKRLHISDMSYPDVAEASLETGPFLGLRKFSKPFRYAVDTCICINVFGSCCVYEIIIAKSFLQLIEETSDLTRLRMYILFLLLPLLLLCMIRSLKFLAPFSLVANFFVVICVCATIYYSLKTGRKLSEVPAWKSWLGLFEFFGVVVFSMDGIGVCLPIENNMKEPRKFPFALCVGMIMVVVFVTSVGFFGYWGFGEESQSPVTLNFPNELFPSVIKGMMAGMISITFAINYWAPINLIWFYVAQKYKPENHWIWERVYRAIIIVIITGVAIAFPNIGNLMGLLGSFCIANLGFTFPAIIDTVLYWERPGLGFGRWRLWKNVLIFLLGVILCISGTYSNVKALIAKM